MLIFPPFHLRWNSARLHYQHGEDTGQDDFIIDSSHAACRSGINETHLWEKQNCAASPLNCDELQNERSKCLRLKIMQEAMQFVRKTARQRQEEDKTLQDNL